MQGVIFDDNSDTGDKNINRTLFVDQNGPIFDQKSPNCLHSVHVVVIDNGVYIYIYIYIHIYIYIYVCIY